MSRERIAEGDVVQIDPLHENVFFRACMLTVTEAKSWGVQGYVQMCGELRDGVEVAGGQAYVRIPNGQFAYIGTAEWMAA